MLVVGEQKLPKRGDPVLIMALIFTFLLYSHFLILFKSTLFVSNIKQGITKEAVNAKIQGRSTSNQVPNKGSHFCIQFCINTV